MLRALIYILVSIFIITLLRGVIGLITKGVGQLFEEQSPTQASNSPTSGAGGELYKCASCGTFSSPKPNLTLQRNGQTLHYCSETCKSKSA